MVEGRDFVYAVDGTVVPYMPPEKLVLVACYGTAADMEHALARYGAANVDVVVEPQGFTALHYAIRRLNLAMVAVLLAAGASPNTPTTTGSTPLLLAAKYNAVNIARVLLRHRDIKPTSLTAHETEQRMTPLMWAAVHGNIELVSALCDAADALKVLPTQLLRATNRFGATPLMLAVAALPARIGASSGEKGEAQAEEASEEGGGDGGTRVSARERQRRLSASGSSLVGAGGRAPVAPTPVAGRDFASLPAENEDDKTGGALTMAAAAAAATRRWMRACGWRTRGALGRPSCAGTTTR